MHRLASSDDFELYRAALEWDLEDPIIIDNEDDLKSGYRWRDKLTPYHHQVTNLITFCRRLPVTLLADDVGLGKTISAGLIASELISRARVSRILIVCPKLLIPQWKEELETKFDIEGTAAPGALLLDAMPSGDVGAVITTYHSARVHLGKLPQDRFDMLVLDEAHKLRNLYGVPNTPKVAQLFRKVLDERRFKYVLMLTATPIQNRLWDIYSLVDLLTVARGHQNPFGGEGMFARKFIADNRTQARQLRPESRDEFKSIAFSYMSRMRRGDANLDFPERKVLPHGVTPSPGELKLIRVIAKPIQKLSALAQISVLQALTSSPDALRAQLDNMAKKGTFPADVAADVRMIVAGMTSSAKLDGLALLIDQLQREEGNRWRMVVFTQRLETQTTIQTFLEKRGIKVGTINGNSGLRNQDTIGRFRKDPPECHVIVSTEAGSEGVNLQVANVLVNYDLPWNPMIVEQRIGRIQRLASKHKYVAIYNVLLMGTFEEYIVGRLLEKLQMASHAIGDIEALLEASGLDDSEDGEAEGFEEQIRKLVLAALQGKDTQAAVRLTEESISRAKEELANQQETINTLLGTDPREKGPKSPRLPPLVRSMDAVTFARRGLEQFGAKLEPENEGRLWIELDGKKELARLANEPREREQDVLLYAPGTAPFERLIRRVAPNAGYHVTDLDAGQRGAINDTLREWVEGFGGQLVEARPNKVWRFFHGAALARVRATVAHDSYERLVQVECSPVDHYADIGVVGDVPLAETIHDIKPVGLKSELIEKAALADEGIEEFCRFYLERKSEELDLAGSDERKKKKLEDEFTPRIESSLVGLHGFILHQYAMDVDYEVGGSHKYTSSVLVTPSRKSIASGPDFGKCMISEMVVPVDCLEKCAISGKNALRHFMKRSDVSSRFALAESTLTCPLTKKNILIDEAERSDITSQLVLATQLVISAVSGTRGEPEHYVSCEFTDSKCLRSEAAVSELSGKTYRIDHRQVSDLSSRAGHLSEFVRCSQTGKNLALGEEERCSVTGTIVGPGILKLCSLSGKRALPEQLSVSGISGNPVISSLMKISAISGTKGEPEFFATCEVTGAEVLQSELARSEISGRNFRSDQLTTSAVSGVAGHKSEFISCSQTAQLLAPSEVERCESTGAIVRPGLLEACAVSNRRVLQSELVRCAATGRKALSKYIVSSSISGAALLEEAAISSSAGKFCSPDEARTCLWGDQSIHPDDERLCSLTDTPFHSKFTVVGGKPTSLWPLVELLQGKRRTRDGHEQWSMIAAKVAEEMGGANCNVEAAEFSPTTNHLAVCVEVRTFLGLRVQYAGLIYAVGQGAIAGRIAVGKRKGNNWLAAGG